MSALWIVIIAIGIATYVTRVAPLLWGRRLPMGATRSGWFERLGPCLIAAMAATVILPSFMSMAAAPDIVPELMGLLAVVVVMRLRSDPGLATLGGMVAHYLVGSAMVYL